MSLLMQALRKAERARSQAGHEPEGGEQEPPAFGQDSVPSPPPMEGGPAFAVMPDAWRLEPLDAEPPVIPAQEAAHDPVPPQARHEPVRPPAPHAAAGPVVPPAVAGARPGSGTGPGTANDQRSVRGNGARSTGLPRAIASSQRRLVILGGTLAAMLAVFAFIYMRAVSGPGPGARLPMVPMPAPGAAPVAQAGALQGAGIPVTPYVTPPATEVAVQGAAPDGAMAANGMAPASTIADGAAAAGAAPVGMAGGSVAAGVALGAVPEAQGAPVGAAPATKPQVDVTIPTPEQLAAIPDPAIRAEAMRDAAERQARQARTEGTAPPSVAAAPATQPAASGTDSAGQAAPPAAAPPVRAPDTVKINRRTTAQAGPERARRQARAPASAAAGASEGREPMKTAVGENGDVHFVRGSAAAQVAPAVQNGYAALKSGDLLTARQQYDLALLQDPNNRDALLGSAAVALREHDGRQASSTYLRLLELDPNDAEALAGLTVLQPGDLQANEIKLKGLARQHPESGPVQFALGNLLARQGRWPEAQQSYFRAFTAMPDNADYAFNLGVGLDRMNQPRLAQDYYRRALELAQGGQPTFNVDAVRKRLQALQTPPQ